MKNLIPMALAAVMTLALCGCTPQAREEYSQAGDKAGEAAIKTGDAMKTDAKVTGEVVKDAAEESRKAVDNSVTTGAVRTAISAAHDLKIKDLNVDTVGNKIILKGIVPDQRSKDQAQAIAVGQAGKEFTVDNQLTIGDVK